MERERPLQLERLQAEFGFSQPVWDVQGHEGRVLCESDRFTLRLYSDYWQIRLHLLDKQKGVELFSPSANGRPLPNDLKERHIPVWDYLDKLDPFLAEALREYLAKNRVPD